LSRSAIDPPFAASISFSTPSTLKTLRLLHELATNATKYGALSNDRGKVMASWTVTSENQNNRLNFKWQETEGPPVAEPTRQGFGSSLIKGMFSNVRFDYAPDGLSCEIDVLLQPSTPSAINTIRSGNQAQVGS
jgi:two-component sensor histidine kinase